MRSGFVTLGVRLARAATVAVLVCASTGALAAQNTYRGVTVDSAGGLFITTTTGRTITLPKDSGQVAFAAPAIAANHRSVGWLAVYPNCCTSYPIPLKLVVRTAEKNRTFEGDGLPIWTWVFIEDGTRVAFRQAPVHGDAPAHYELHDLATGKLVSTFDTQSDSVAVATKSSDRRPGWVRLVDATKPFR